MTSPDLKPEFHGGDLAAAQRQYPGAPQPWIDLSTGINPHAYPVDAINGDVWARLPQKTDKDALRTIAAQYFGAREARQVVLAPGSQALIQLLPIMFDGTSKCVTVVGPTYAEHALCWARAGHKIVEAGSLAECEGTDVAVVVNPNNPTGRLYSVNELTACAQDMRQHKGLLIIDEAFADFLPRENSIVQSLPPSTIVLRSFGKTFGLAGVRLGFAIGEPALVEKLNGALGPWAVSSPALTIGTQALADTKWIDATRQRLESDGARLASLLEDADFSIVGRTPYFQLAQHEGAVVISDVLGRRGIYVRRFSYNKTWLRFGLPGNSSSWTRLQDALAAVRDAPV